MILQMIRAPGISSSVLGSTHEAAGISKTHLTHKDSSKDPLNQDDIISTADTDVLRCTSSQWMTRGPSPLDSFSGLPPLIDDVLDPALRLFNRFILRLVSKNEACHF